MPEAASAPELSRHTGLLQGLQVSSQMRALEALATQPPASSYSICEVGRGLAALLSRFGFLPLQSRAAG